MNDFARPIDTKSSPPAFVKKQWSNMNVEFQTLLPFYATTKDAFKDPGFMRAWRSNRGPNIRKDEWRVVECLFESHVRTTKWQIGCERRSTTAASSSSTRSTPRSSWNRSSRWSGRGQHDACRQCVDRNTEVPEVTCSAHWWSAHLLNLVLKLFHESVDGTNLLIRKFVK